MAQLSEKFKNIVLDDIKQHPELIIGMLFNDNDVSIILEKRGNTVRYACLRTYDNESRRILEEAEREYIEKKQRGYNRDQAFNDLTEALEEITAQMKSQSADNLNFPKKFRCPLKEFLRAVKIVNRKTSNPDTEMIGFEPFQKNQRNFLFCGIIRIFGRFFRV